MNTAIQVNLRFFASLREQLGCAELVVTLPAEVATVGQLRDWLMLRGGVWAQALSHDRILRMAYQQVMCEASEPLQRSDPTQEIAFFPPVTGG